MTKALQVAAIGVLSIGLLFPATGAAAEPRPAVADEIANTYGFQSFDRIDAIRYTFNLDAGPLKVKRSWVWEPKTNRVTYDGPDKAGKPVKVTYSRFNPSKEEEAVKEATDPGFINDQYWLLFPFHLIWDTGPAVKDEGTRKLPLGKGSARKVAVSYSSDVGYTPGDTWDLYLGKDGRIQQLAFHHGGAAKPKEVLATWADYKKAGPLLFSTNHRGTADGKPLRLFFSDVAVKLSGSNDWVEAR